MKNQFFYTRTEGEHSFRDSFNINRIIRAFRMDETTLIVLLDDLHDEYRMVPIQVSQGKDKGKEGQEMRKVSVCSEIPLTGEDITRFENLLNIE